MATNLRLVALGIAIVTVALWFFGGPNWGTTRIWDAQRYATDDGPQQVIWEYRFLPGLDFLAA